MTVWRQVQQAQTRRARSIAKMASGRRIVHAAADAAGLAISERMQAQIRGLRQAARNTQDAIALAETAEGAMAGIHELLLRLRELAVQAPNDTLTDQDREHLESEFRQLLGEISRSRTATEFNAQALLDGSFQGHFQVGPGAGDTVMLAIPDVWAAFSESQVGRYVPVTDIAGWSWGNAYFDASQNHWVIQDLASSRDSSGTLWDFLPTIGNDPMTVTWTRPPDPAIFYATVETIGTVWLEGAVSGTLVFDPNLSVQGDEAYGEYRIEAVQDFPDGTYRVGFDGSRYVLFDTSGRVVAGSPDGGLTYRYAESLGKDRLEFPDPVLMGTVTVAGTSVVAEGNVGWSVATRDKAERTLGQLQQAIDRLSALRGHLGAFQNRLERTLNRLLMSQEDLVAAESRIADADMGAEMMEFVRNQILLQFGTAMLAQANVLPQAVLRFLASPSEPSLPWNR